MALLPPRARFGVGAVLFSGGIYRVAHPVQPLLVREGAERALGARPGRRSDLGWVVTGSHT